MSLNDQNNLQIVSDYKPLRDQNNLEIDLSAGQVIITTPFEGQVINQNTLYEWGFSGDNTYFRVEVATKAFDDPTFVEGDIVQKADVQAKKLANNIPDGTGYIIRISALNVVQPSSSEITGVSLNTSVNEVQEGNTITIRGTVEGNGDFDPSGTWERLAGGDEIPFTQSGNEIAITGDIETNTADFEFSSDQDPTFSVVVSVTVTVASTVTQVDTPQGDRDSLELIYNATQGQILPVLASSSDIPDQDPYTTNSYLINNEVWVAWATQSNDGTVTQYSENTNKGIGWDNDWDINVVQNGDLGTLWGVTTDADGRVIELDLRSNNLIGELPEFPGLQRCWKLGVKQLETGMEGSYRFLAQRITGRIPDSIGNNTIVTHLSLAGRSNSDGTPRDVFSIPVDETPDYNMKFSVAANQFEQGIPASLYNLQLEIFEIDGQSGQFASTLEEGCSNWNIVHFYGHGNMWHYDTGPAFTGAFPSGSKAWVNCMFMSVGDNGWTSYHSDMFQGWNDLPLRYINIGRSLGSSNSSSDLIDTQLPDLSNLSLAREIRLNDVGWQGAFPIDLISYPNIAFMNITNHRFNDSRDIGIQNINSGIRSVNLRLVPYIAGEGNLSGHLFTGPATSNRMTIFHTQDNTKLQSVFHDTVWKWAYLRYYDVRDCASGVLPTKPPGWNAPSFTKLLASNSGITGSISAEWGDIGSTVVYGGVIHTGTITDYGTDAQGFWIEDANASYVTNELVPVVGDPGPILNYPNASPNNLREIISNTGQRIYYDSSADHLSDYGTINIGDTYEIVRNANKDVRALHTVFLQDNELSGLIPEGAAPKNLGVNYGTAGAYFLFNNKFTIKDIAPSIDAFQTLATANNWNYVYAPQKPFSEIDVRTIVAGNPVTIDFSAEAYTGNVYQWKKKAVGSSDYVALSDTQANISGSETDTLTISNFQSADSGDYILEITNPATPDFSGADALKSGITTLKL